MAKTHLIMLFFNNIYVFCGHEMLQGSQVQMILAETK